MKITLAQLNYHIGNIGQNLAAMKAAVAKSRAMGADLAVFSELAITGYPPRDFLEFDDFITACEDAMHELAKESKDIGIIAGSPSRNSRPQGKNIFNSAWFMTDGKVNAIVSKSLLPTYDVFDEYRYFEPGKERNVIAFHGKRIALTICEDLWDIGNDPMYTVCPMDELIKQKPDLIINISGSPFHYRHASDRIRVLGENARKYKLPVFYLNHIGSQTELIFDGGSLVISGDGSVYDEMVYFREAIEVYDLDAVTKGRAPREQPKDEAALIHDALVLGVGDYFRKMGFKDAIIGLSGGIDSAVTLALAVKALGAGNVKAVMMPSEFSSPGSVEDSKELVKRLAVKGDIIPIQSVYTGYLELLEPWFRGKKFSVAEENIQARIRGNLLMALANKLNYILLNTSNKSEIAAGYGTLYGDLAGGLAVLGDVYKTKVYGLAAYINRSKELIPQAIIDKEPSAELSPGQKDMDSLPPYEVLDKILFLYIEGSCTPKQIVEKGFDEGLVRRVMDMVNRNEYKRYQTPPILRVSPKAFGMGRRMPIVAKYWS